MLMFGLRLGNDPRAVVTTTPEPIKSDRRRPDRRRNGIGNRGRRRDAEPGGASAGAGAAEPDPGQLGHARDALVRFFARSTSSTTHAHAQGASSIKDEIGK
jgi:hypothetical protein